MTVFLALRTTDAPGALPKLFSWLTRARLITKFPHAGIVIGSRLYHANAAKGLHSEEFNPDGWSLFYLDVSAHIVLNRFAKVAGAKYDWLSLLAFVVPWRVSVSKWMYCYEWCWYALTGELPRKRVTPEDLLTFSRGLHGSDQSAG